MHLHTRAHARLHAREPPRAHLEVALVGAEVDGHESEPDDAGGVHGEGDVLRLVEVGGDAACLERVHGAHHDEDHVIEKREDDGDVGTATLQDDGASVGEDERRVGQVDAEPRDGDDELHADEARTDDELRAWACVARPLHHGAHAAVEDARDAVGFGEDSRVADGEREPEPGAHHHARHDVRLRHHDERHHVAAEQAELQHEAELAPRRHDHRRRVEAQEDGEHEDDQQDAGGRCHHQEDRPRVVERHVVHVQQLARRLVGVRVRAVAARDARALVGEVLVLGAPDAHPAAVVQVLAVLVVAGLAGRTAHGRWQRLRAALPPHTVPLDVQAAANSRR